MNEARTDIGGLGAPASSSTWDSYYREASRRRRKRGHTNHWLREQKRRRRTRERIGLSISALFVGALTLIFYLVLSR